MLAAASASTVPIHCCAACSVKYARSAPISIARLDSRLSANAANLLYPECRRMTKSPISCGRISRKTAPSRVPIAKLTSAGTQLAGAESANIAAITMLITPPATVAAEIQAIVAMLLAFLQPDEARHSAGGAVSTKGEKTLLARSTELAPIDLGDPCCGEPLPRKVVEIGEVRP